MKVSTMKFTDNALNVLTSKSFKGIGRAWIIKHIKGNESTTELVTLLNHSVKQENTISTAEFESRKKNIRSQFDKLKGFVDGIVAIGDSNFPIHRGIVKNSEKPIVLFYRGDLRLLEKQNQNVTVIGLLDPDEDAEKFEKLVVSSLVDYGATIVSGLALGCDTIAHEQTLLSNGKTIAILPSPINYILPRSNQELAERIVQKGGLLVSEYYEKANSRSELGGRYQERDRLQALFSDCVILSASYAKNKSGNDSGARHAMNYASRYSINRAIMYDAELNAENPKYDLNRQIISEDNNVTILNKDTMQEALRKLISKQASPLKGDNWLQKGLF